MSEVEAAEAKVKEFERKNVQIVSEMKQQANKDIEEALASARAKFAKGKGSFDTKIDEERRQSRLKSNARRSASKRNSNRKNWLFNKRTTN